MPAEHNEQAFRDLIRVVNLPDAEISSLEARMQHATYWETEVGRRERIIGSRPRSVSLNDFEMFRQIQKFSAHISDMLSIIDDTLRPRRINEIDDLDFTD